MSIIRKIDPLSASYDGSAFLLEDSISLREGDRLYVLTVPESVTDRPIEVTVSSCAENTLTLTEDAVFTGLVSGDKVSFGYPLDVYNPQSFQWDLSDLESGSGRNQMGKTFKDRIDVKRSLSCAWGALNNSQMSQLIRMMQELFFILEYPDALSGEREIRTFGVSNKSTPMMRQQSDGTWMWQSLSVTFTER